MKRNSWLFAALAFCTPSLAMADDGSADEITVEFVTLGTGGGPVIRNDRGQPANAVVVNDRIYLFDIGAGTQHQLVRAGLDYRQVAAVFLSHHHIDHVADLGPFLVNRWLLGAYDPIPVIGPRGTAFMALNIAAASEPIELAPVTIGGPTKPELETTFLPRDLPAELETPTVVYRDENISVLAVTNAHFNFEAGTSEDLYSRSYSYRIETPARTYVFTGDTGASENLVALASGADVLVSEVIDMEAIAATLAATGVYAPETLGGLLAHMREDHLTPEQVGQLADRAGVGEVVLTHLVPGNDNETDFSGYLKGLDEHFDGPVTIAQDLDEF